MFLIFISYVRRFWGGFHYLLYSLNRILFPYLCFKKQIKADPTTKNQSHPPHQQAKEEKSYSPIGKSVWQNLIPTMIKESLGELSRGELPQLDKARLQEISSMTRCGSWLGRASYSTGRIACRCCGGRDGGRESTEHCFGEMLKVESRALRRWWWALGQSHTRVTIFQEPPGKVVVLMLPSGP